MADHFRIMITGGRTFGAVPPEKDHPLRAAKTREYEFVMRTMYTETRAFEVFEHYPGLSILSGAATGADACVEEWALVNGVSVERFPANWNDVNVPGAVIRRSVRTGRLYNVLAGFQRNQAMIDSKPDLVLAFPGGKGTADAVRRARAAGIVVKEFAP